MALFVTEAGGKPVGFTWNNQIRRWIAEDGGMQWTDEAFKDRFIPVGEDRPVEDEPETTVEAEAEFASETVPEPAEVPAVRKPGRKPKNAPNP